MFLLIGAMNLLNVPTSRIHRQTHKDFKTGFRYDAFQHTSHEGLNDNLEELEVHDDDHV